MSEQIQSIAPFRTAINGAREWKQLPNGYRQLVEGETVLAGDVMRAGRDWFCEYPEKSFLIGKLPGDFRGWYRKVEPT